MRTSDIRRQIASQLPHLRRFAYALTDNREAADDLVQASAEKALRRADQWRGDGRLRSWLFRILYTTHLNVLQSETRHRGIDLDSIEGVVGVHPRQETVVNCLDIAQELSRLPRAQRDVLVLVALEDVTYEEAAEILDVPVGTVRSRLSRAREALRLADEPRRPVLCRVK